MTETSLDHLRPGFTAGTLTSSLAARLRKAIMDGVFPPGAKLRTEELRQTYKVSLSPLREALSRLSMDGLVETEDQKGYRVARVSAENLEEITLLRTELESTALKKAIANGSEAWEAGIVAAFYRLEKAESRGVSSASIEDWELAHREFHNMLISAANLPLLLRMCASLHDLSDRYRRLFLRERPFDRDVNGEHRAIMEATLARNADQAAGLLRQHIQRTARNLGRAFDRAAS